uniref:Uncharacterized protein n=1 Tax=Romanomermis culicivorax TaxID=13658 RepID=A0A915JFK6_ROMCU
MKPITCQSGYWQCHNRLQCIEQNAKCDGNDDCYDASDEENCPVTSKNVEAVTKRMPDIGLPPYQGPGGSNENSPKQPSMELLKGKETDGPQYISTSKETPSPETELTTELPPATELTTELQS